MKQPTNLARRIYGFLLGASLRMVGGWIAIIAYLVVDVLYLSK